MTTKYVPASAVEKPEPNTGVRCVALRLSDSDVLTRVHGGIKSLWRGKYTAATLWYKPHWQIDARLNRPLSSTSTVQVVAVVDGLTGIARCRRPGSPSTDLVTEQIDDNQLVATIVDASGASEAAEQTIRRMARRRRLQIGRLDQPLLFYRPVWLIARQPGEAAAYAVDAQSGVLARVLS